MPWVKDFDVDDAVDRAMKVFWAKGYEATSISDLVKAMEINKGSLYNAFGSKKDLFTRAFLKYDVENRQATIRQLEAMDDPVRAIEVLFDGLIAESLDDAERKGCLLVNTALDLPNQPQDIRDMVTSALDGFEAFFERRIRDGQKIGRIPASIDAKEAARALLTLVVGLRVLARGTFGAAGLEAIRAQALRTIGA